MRACPNGHSIEDDRARICPACGSLLFRHERISAPVLGLAFVAVALAIGLFAAWMALQQPRSGPSPSSSPQTYDGGPTVVVG